LGVPTISRTNLVISAQRGDPTAIERLLVACQTDARRYAQRHCRVSDIDDAVQEALLTISRKVTALRNAAAFSSWLFVVIKRECRKLERVMFQTTALEDDVARPAPIANYAWTLSKH